MTTESLTGLATSFYPMGRSPQRPATLHPDSGEGPSGVISSLREESARLHDLWAGLSPADWGTEIKEPEDNRDLGPTTIAHLALLRLTEVEVHGGDLGLGLEDWSDVFVDAALPARIGWLSTRRSNHRAVDPHLQGSWLLVAEDSRCWRISISGDQVTVQVSDSRGKRDVLDADCEIRGSSRDLLATLVGRSTTGSLALSGDTTLARGFSRAFPGP